MKTQLDNVRNKVCVAAIGVLSTGLAVLSSFGLLLFASQPFVMTVASSPFMILGIGIDDMFILLCGWQRTSVLDSVPARLADTLRDTGVSIALTSLTDALTLFLGYSSPFGSVQSFCLYAGTAVAFCFCYNVTLLGAFLALNGQREASHRHWLTCAKVPEDLPPGKSQAYALCCVGGAYDQATGAEEDQPVNRFFRTFYGPFLTRRWTKVCVVVVYVGYLSVSCFGCSRMKEGIDLRTLALDDSYIIEYYDSQSQHFSEYGPNVMVAVNETFPYWSQEGRQTLSACISNFEAQLYVKNSSSHAWFLSFQLYANVTNSDIISENDYKNHLIDFLEMYPMFRMDINSSADNQIQSSRFFIQTLNNTSEKELLTGLRATAEECPMELLVYHPSFIYYDQYTVIVDNTIQTAVVAVVAMLAVCLLLIPDPLCSLWVALTVSSVTAGVAGAMALWGVHLNAVSMINLITCIGFSVDFAAHVSYAFVTSTKRDPHEKVVEALANVGYPIMQGGVSTILGVVMLSIAGNYIFRTFFKIIFLVIVFGMLHGLVFVPVFLTLFGNCG
ncbi:patched domain-containing protein 3-like [Aplochiton taeniatus]